MFSLSLILARYDITQTGTVPCPDNTHPPVQVVVEFACPAILSVEPSSRRTLSDMLQNLTREKADLKCKSHTAFLIFYQYGHFCHDSKGFNGPKLEDGGRVRILAMSLFRSALCLLFCQLPNQGTGTQEISAKQESILKENRSYLASPSYHH